VIAALAIVVAKQTGNANFDAFGSIMIGCLLACVCLCVCVCVPVSVSV